MAHLDGDALPLPHRRVHLPDGAAGDRRALERLKVALERHAAQRDLHLSPSHVERVLRRSGVQRGQAVAQLARQQIRTRRCPLPPLDEQRARASGGVQDGRIQQDGAGGRHDGRDWSDRKRRRQCHRQVQRTPQQVGHEGLISR